MVGEGRQILRNIQRVARLFVTKTVFTAVVVVAVGIPTATYPLLPRQFTIASTVTIGIPAFLIALAPSSGPWRPENFLRSVASFAVPAGVGIGLGIVSGYLLARYGFDLNLKHSRTVATGIVVVCGLAAIIRLEHRRGSAGLLLWCLCALMLGVFALALVIPPLRNFYELATPTGEIAVAWAVGTIVGIGGMLGGLRLARGLTATGSWTS
jgi:magnesium-transporting ATPase (P-type)